MKARTVSLKSNSLSPHHVSALRIQPILSSIFLIIFTSNSGILLLSLGANSFCPKPTKIRRILAAVFFFSFFKFGKDHGLFVGPPQFVSD